MGAYTYLNKFFPGGLAERAKQAHYDEDNILILQGDEVSLKTNYRQTYDNIRAILSFPTMAKRNNWNW